MSGERVLERMRSASGTSRVNGGGFEGLRFTRLREGVTNTLGRFLFQSDGRVWARFGRTIVQISNVAGFVQPASPKQTQRLDHPIQPNP